MLTGRQRELLKYINEKMKETGVSPSYDEMRIAVNLSSKSGIHRLINALEEIEFPLTPSLEINLLRIGVDYLASEDHIIILFDDQESIENGESPKLRIELSRKMTNEFIEKTRLLASTGRPKCPLCHKIVEEDGNCLFCPKKNGHSKDADLPKLI